MSQSGRTEPDDDGPTERRASVSNRLDVLDVARGVALVAMGIYHFTWDLEFFGYVERGMTGMGGWKLFARCIASSFLFLAGVGLVLAHGRGIRWRSFRRRFAQVAAGAAIITLTTYVATPQGFVFFGILHQIALASLLGLLFVRLPWFATAAAGIAVIVLPQLFQTPLTDPKALAWIGFSARPPVSNDFVPLFPWFGAVLLGIAAARLMTDRGGWAAARALDARLPKLRLLGWLGRRSLIVYLVHQPVLIGLVWTFAQIAPPDPQRMIREIAASDCMTSYGDEAFCRVFSGCMGDRMGEAGLVEPFLNGLSTTEEDGRIAEMSMQCAMPLP